ncbi:hypothetical protein ACOSQ3_023698 [Xanthoceras sorbifolium]
MKVKSFNLMETLGNKACLVLHDRTIGVSFDPKNPFTPYYFPSSKRRNKGSSLVPLKSLKLFIHGYDPLRMLEGLKGYLRFNIRPLCQQHLRFKHSNLRTSNHRVHIMGCIS